MMRQDHAGLATWHSINQSMKDSDMVDTTWRSHVVDVAEEFREAGARDRFADACVPGHFHKGVKLTYNSEMERDGGARIGKEDA